jgi:hypothetical protein
VTKSTTTTCWQGSAVEPSNCRAWLQQSGPERLWRRRLAVSGMFGPRFAAVQPVPSREGLVQKRAFLTIIAAQRHDSPAAVRGTLPLAEG